LIQQREANAARTKRAGQQQRTDRENEKTKEKEQSCFLAG
jgi:hypothetical protein